MRYRHIFDQSAWEGDEQPPVVYAAAAILDIAYEVLTTTGRPKLLMGAAELARHAGYVATVPVIDEMPSETDPMKIN